MPAPWQLARDRAASDPRFLDLTDSRFHQNALVPPSEPFRRAFDHWLSHRAYDPDSRGLPVAREALSRFYASEGWTVPPGQFFLTASTSEAYTLIFSCLADAGASVALPRPGYPLFEHLAAHSRLQTVFYDQPWELGWSPDPSSLERCLRPDTRFVVVISPNNPTGQTLSSDALAAVAAVCRRRDLILVVDEVFDAFWEGAESLPRPGRLFPEVKVLTLNGISKRFGSPDLKLAWVAVTGPSAWVARVEATFELANDTFLSANSYSQALLPSLFETLGPWQESVRRVLAVNRDRVAAWLRSETRVQGTLPSGGIHGLWRFEGLPRSWDDERWALTLLDRDKVALHPGYFYDVQEPGVWLVYSLLKEPTAFHEGLERVAARLSSPE